MIENDMARAARQQRDDFSMWSLAKRNTLRELAYYTNELAQHPNSQRLQQSVAREQNELKRLEAALLPFKRRIVPVETKQHYGYWTARGTDPKAVGAGQTEQEAVENMIETALHWQWRRLSDDAARGDQGAPLAGLEDQVDVPR